MRTFAAACALGLVALFAPAANAAETVVEMLNKDTATNETYVFKPAVVRIAKGDTVKWVATQPGHNVQFIMVAVPAGVAPFSSGFTKEIKFTFDKPGIYLYKCTPHAGFGMVGFVVVGGDKSNLAAVKAAIPSLPTLSQKRANALIAQVEAP